MTYQHRAKPDWSVLEDITWYLVKISFEKHKVWDYRGREGGKLYILPPSVYWTFRQLDRSIASHDWIKFHILITVCHKTKKQIDNDQYCREKNYLNFDFEAVDQLWPLWPVASIKRLMLLRAHTEAQSSLTLKPGVHKSRNVLPSWADPGSSAHKRVCYNFLYRRDKCRK